MVAQREEEYYLLPGDLPEDILQEQAIAKLTGKKVSIKRMRGGKDLGYGLRPIASAIPIWSRFDRPNYASFEKLTEFLMGLEEGIKREVIEYLSEPDEGRLLDILTNLGMKVEKPQATPITLTNLIEKALPATLDQLYELARNVHFSRRPEAAVRQNVRNLVKRHRAIWKGQQLCRVGDSVKQTSKP